MSYAAAHPSILDTQSVRLNLGSRLTKRDVLLRSVAVATLFVVLSLQLWVRVSTTAMAYYLEEQRELALKNDLTLRQLKLELAVEKRPASLNAAAKNRLSLGPLSPQNVRKLVVGKVNVK